MSKKTLTDEELFAQFEDIPSATPDATKPPKPSRPSEPAKGDSPKPTTQNVASQDVDDPLAELSALAAARPPPSRPETPRISSSTTTSGTNRRIETPTGSSPPSARTSEDKSRHAKSGPVQMAHTSESAVASPATNTGATSSSGTGGWWGSVYNVASAAVNQASAAVNEIRANEEAMKWAELVRTNAEKAKAYGDNVRSLALPTFTNILQTIAPPISAHERLLIHTSHDLVGYPSMDPLIYAVFARVMSQVEGGDLLVIQRGSESRLVRERSSSEAAYKGSSLGSSAGWTDGPWWRDTAKRDLGAVNGIVEGTKLSRASAEAYAHEYFAAKGGIEEAAKLATENVSESNPVRNSDIFMSIQPITGVQRDDLFAAGPQKEDATSGGVVEPEATADDATAFAVYLYDPVHSITCSTMSQSFPTKWALWLDSPGSTDTDDNRDPATRGLPDSVREMIESGGIDPREWAAEWLEEVLSLAVGLVAQIYVAKRMGVGSGAISRGKARVRAEEDAAGEAARAGVI